MARRGRKRDGGAAECLARQPYRQLRNPFPAIDVLDAGQTQRIHDASMSILEDVGMRILDPGAAGVLETVGFRHDPSQQLVKFDRDILMDLVARAPPVATVRGYDPAKRITMGGNAVAFAALGGAPFVSDLDKGRRPGTLNDLQNLLKLTHTFNIMHISGGASVEPQDIPVPVRHLDFFLSSCLISDKPWKPQGVGATRATDALAMARILYQTDDAGLAADPVFFVNT
ncbi:MAG: trimethylamine methyltransferase family protein, partial [Hyphomicrobiaceae bacterium]